MLAVGIRLELQREGSSADLEARRKQRGNNVTTATVTASDWYETAKLNYGFNFVDRSRNFDPRPRTWLVMDEVIGYWQAKGIEGFRCDFAHYIPAEFWTWLISQARQRDPGAYFVAEAYPSAASGDPVTDMRELTSAGFDAVYHDAAYDALKRIYLGAGSQDDYAREMGSPPDGRRKMVEYLENHDERRIASPIVPGGGLDGSGFGSADAGYQSAPMQYLYVPGPVIMLNGQEVGEPGAGAEGFNTDDGRTTFFDYWAMPEFVRWVNGHAYDGGGLSDAQRQLREFYSALLALCRDPSVQAEGYWGLKYFNRPERFGDCPGDLYSFARFADGSGRALVVVANFRPNSATQGHIRLPQELASAAGLDGGVVVRLVLDQQGQRDTPVASLTVNQLESRGFPVSIPNQSAQVYSIARASP